MLACHVGAFFTPGHRHRHALLILVVDFVTDTILSKLQDINEFSFVSVAQSVFLNYIPPHLQAFAPRQAPRVSLSTRPPVRQGCLENLFCAIGDDDKRDDAP